MPVWPYEHGEYRYCRACGDVWKVGRRGQVNPHTGVYRESINAEDRPYCNCLNQPRLVVMRDQVAAEAAFRVGGDAGVRALTPAARAGKYTCPDVRSWERVSEYERQNRHLRSRKGVVPRH